MKRSLRMLLIGWRSFDLAFENPFTTGELRLPQSRRYRFATLEENT